MSHVPRRFVLTGAPGAGKTSILDALEQRGWAVVQEAATDVIARLQGAGVAEPWTDPSFCDRIVALQRERQERPVEAPVQVFDRSPLCTLALARYLGHPVTPRLASEVERVVAEGVYERQVILVRPLGFIVPTEARRISYAESLAFEKAHEQAYAEYGFDMVELPAGELRDRAAAVEATVESVRYHDRPNR